MQPDAGALLWDARRAAELIFDFVASRTWQDYQSDAMLRSAVERQFEIIGESLNRLNRIPVGGFVSDLERQVVGVDHVWQLTRSPLPTSRTCPGSSHSAMC